ncbi:uncharacterized protein LOC116851551 [Odontomachus brunneus]|uniref:uncharacterized protein LOC116851551 n=1 Tax=Odontomachus brunneus TaxID=486640 RepID=UPI0013F284A3|nr:uncharacterized protein LOC116851551 [Odontomachus brunneus]
MVLHAFIVLSIVMFGLCATEKLDLSVSTCKRNSSHYNSCLKRAINEAWPLFVKGLPAEFEFPPLDPFFYNYERVVVDSGEIHAEVIVSNITVEGLKDLRVVAVKPHFSNDSFRLVFNTYIPKLLVEGVIKAKGAIGGFRMGGEGYFNMSIEDTRTPWNIFGPVKNDTWIIEHFLVSPMVKNFKVYLHNLFEGNQEINELAVTFVNEYWPLLMRLTMPTAIEMWDRAHSADLTRLFAKLSFSKLFP